MADETNEDDSWLYGSSENHADESNAAEEESKENSDKEEQMVITASVCRLDQELTAHLSSSKPKTRTLSGARKKRTVCQQKKPRAITRRKL